jgi:hypothetical protein
MTTELNETGLPGTLCYSGYEIGKSITWSVRRQGTESGSVRILYRNRTPYSRHNTSDSAWAAFTQFVPSIDNPEEMGR